MADRALPTARLAPGLPAARANVILPFDNAGSADDDFFVEGMHESLIGELQEAGLAVIGRRSVMQFADNATAPVREIAARLGTDAVVEGDAYRRGDSVGITLRSAAVVR